MKRLPILLSFVLFLGVCMSGTYWALQFIKPQPRPVAPIKETVHNDVNPEAIMSLFGGHLSAAAASNFQLKGVVVSSKNNDESVAILVADGKPAEAVRVGKEIAGAVVKEVHPQYVMLSENGVMKRVELPQNAPAHGDLPILAPMAPPQQPIQQIPAPQTGQEAEQQQPPPQYVQPQVLPPQPPPLPDGPQGRIGRSAQRGVRNNLNNNPPGQPQQ